MSDVQPRILCVDDEPSNLRLLEALLIPRGYEVITAENGRDALRLIAEQKIDLVLLDVMLPGADGYEVCRQIKGNDRHRDIPIVMITALNSKQDRIRSIEAGAEDFISKPFCHAEVLARLKMLLHIRELNGKLSQSYADISKLTSFGEDMVTTFDPLNYDFLAKLDGMIGKIIRIAGSDGGKPEIALIGISDKSNGREWLLYRAREGAVKRHIIDLGIHRCLVANGAEARSEYYNEGQLETAHIGQIIRKVAAEQGPVRNAVSCHSDEICIHAFNYGRTVTSYDAAVLNSIVMQSLFLKSLASQVRETEDAFDYVVHSLARAAEANDEDTGNHILRVGEYCALLAKELGMHDKFVGILRIQATLHDVGKIHIHPDTLRKPGRFTPGEFEEMKKHTVYGGKILGDHVRLTLAKQAALSHHERWDGTGYPFGLREDQIPLAGRILNIADQYDALRNRRAYKSAFDHATTCGILIEGDGRTMPHHFDPQVLQAFRRAERQFEEIYAKMAG